MIYRVIELTCEVEIIWRRDAAIVVLIHIPITADLFLGERAFLSL